MDGCAFGKTGPIAKRDGIAAVPPSDGRRLDAQVDDDDTGRPDGDDVADGDDPRASGHGGTSLGTDCPDLGNVARDGQRQLIDALKAQERKRAAEQLKKARISAGYNTATDFARAAGINRTSYLHHELGNRSIGPRAAALYATILKIPVERLLSRASAPKVIETPVVGTIAEAGRIIPMPQRSQVETVPPLDENGLVAHRIVGDALYPVYRHGDFVLHKPLVEHHFDVDAIDGMECIVRFSDGTEMLRMVTVQRNGRVTLTAYHAPIMMDQVIIAGQPALDRRIAQPERVKLAIVA